MEPWLIILIFFSALIILLALGLPVAFTLGALGAIGTFLLWPSGIFQIADTAFAHMTGFTLVAVPLFLFMAEMLLFSGLSDDLYGTLRNWLGRLPGGLASATIVASAVFGAISGSSVAGAATMGTVALPSMHDRGYDKSLSTGTVCAGGALSSLIPPSIIMILYGAQTDESIGQLFIGGIIPGIMLSLLFMIYITIACSLNKQLGPAGPSVSWKVRFTSLWKLTPAVILIVVVLGSIYGGIATPTESAGIGAVGALLITAGYGKLNWHSLSHSLLATVRTGVMIMWIIIGAIAFVHFITFSGLSVFIRDVITGLPISRWLVMIMMQLILLVLGCFLDPLGIIYITTPIFLPIIHALDFNGLWYGILFTINMEAAFITPPFGFNLFVISSIAPKGVTIRDIYKGIIPFVILDLIGLALVMIFPQLALWLPGTMMKR